MSVSTSAVTTGPNFTRPLVLFGPSGTGKSTLLKKLFEEFPGKFGFSVSHTTRQPREGEENGIAYHFTTRGTFESLIADGAFIEHAEFSKNLYGTSAKAVSDFEGSGKRCLLDIDTQGVKLIKANHPGLNPVFLFIAPPSFSTLKDRLSGRGTETEQSLQNRLAAAQSELAYASVPGSADVILVNDDLERAYKIFRDVALGNQSVQGDELPADLKVVV
ncbi:guanylate kinase [Phaffia rhodozyma]|uniref:Guanylate kinase n=1 Tax=Phaffia rhodozyma TaxID=264483 RepID=A0A0F7SMX5_PHARH|nr:guanylate kinase [Phaffia rhodozyma]